MRKTEVPQFGQTPLMAGLPFLSVTFWGFLISMFALHFTQYAWGISRSTGAAFTLCWYNKLTHNPEIPRETNSEMSGAFRRQTLVRPPKTTYHRIRSNI